MVTKRQFSVIIVPSPFIIWHSSTRKSVLFFPFIYPCMLGQTHGSLSYSMGYHPLQLLTELEAWAAAARGPSRCLLGPFQPHTVLCIYILSAAPNRIRLISNVHTSNPVKSATFLRVPGFFQWRIVYRQRCGCRVCLLLWDVTVSRPSQWTELGHACK